MTGPNNNVSEINPNHRIYEITPMAAVLSPYDDDGVTEEYRQGKSVRTRIESDLDGNNNVTVTVHPAVGDFTGFDNKNRRNSAST